MSVKTMLKRKFMDFAKDESGMGTGIVEKVFGTITKRQDTIIAD